MERFPSLQRFAFCLVSIPVRPLTQSAAIEDSRCGTLLIDGRSQATAAARLRCFLAASTAAGAAFGTVCLFWCHCVPVGLRGWKNLRVASSLKTAPAIDARPNSLAFVFGRVTPGGLIPQANMGKPKTIGYGQLSGAPQMPPRVAGWVRAHQARG